MRTRLPAVSLSVVSLLLCSPFPARSEPAVLQLSHKFTAPASLVTGRSYRFTFRLCDTAGVGAGNVVWEESALHKVPAGRAIVHQLGSVIPFSNDATGALPLPPVDFSQQLWVEVRRGTALVGPGRVRLAPVIPYALWSAGAGAGSVTSLAIADGTVRDEDIAPDAAIADGKLGTIATPGKVADSALSGNVMLLDGSQTVTGPKTFAPGSGAPFAVDYASRGMVANLDAERVGGATLTDLRNNMVFLDEATLAEAERRFVHNPAYTAGASYRHWVISPVDGPYYREVSNSSISMTIGSDGLPLISYAYDYSGKLQVKVAHCGNASCSDGNSLRTVNMAPELRGGPTSIIVGMDGLPLIAYSTPTDLGVWHCMTPTCSSIFLTAGVAPYPCRDLSIMIGSDGLPVISCTGLRLLHCTEAHCQTDIPDHRINYHDLGPGGQNNALTIGADGFPLISDSGVTVFQCGNVDCSDHRSSRVAGGGPDAPTSIAVGGDGLPVVAYSAPDPRVLHCDSADCSLRATAPNSLEAVSAVSSSMAIGANGLPVVAYCDDHDNLKVAQCGDPTCTTGTVIETVATMPTAGCTYTALTIGADGLPVVAYYDRSDRMLKVAKLLSVPLGRR